MLSCCFVELISFLFGADVYLVKECKNAEKHVVCAHITLICINKKGVLDRKECHSLDRGGYSPYLCSVKTKELV